MKTRSKRALGISIISAGVLLIAAAAILFLHNTGQDRSFEKTSEEILGSVRQVIEERQALSINANENDFSAAPTAEIDGNEYIGILKIPSIELEMPVFGSWDEEKLKKALCRYHGRADKGDLVIAGHNYSSGFGKLQDLNRGESVYFTDINGKVYTYAISETEMLSPDDVQPMVESNWQLSLYTCNYSGSQRFTVRCSLRQ